MNRNTVIVIGLLAALLVPLGVGYATAPCDAFGEPVLLVGSRPKQQRFLKEAGAWIEDLAEVDAALVELVSAPLPRSTGEAFRLAERAGQAAGKLDALLPPEAPSEYRLLGQEMDRTRDTYAYAVERLLAFYGSDDATALAEAKEALILAGEQRAEVLEGIEGLTPPLCREVWKGEGAGGSDLQLDLEGAPQP